MTQRLEGCYNAEVSPYTFAPCVRLQKGALQTKGYRWTLLRGEP